jgi:hypothetical protein
LEDGPPIFRQDFTCPALLVASSVPHRSFHVRGYHPLWPAFPSCSVKSCAITCRLFRFRSPLLSESRLMSFPRATEMFQFTRFASHDYVFIMRYLLRRLSRPSSPVIAKASTTCSYSLDPITLTSLARAHRLSRNCEVFHLARYAVLLNRIASKLKFILDAIKNSVIGGTVCTKPLRMCSFRQQR